MNSILSSLTFEQKELFYKKLVDLQREKVKHVCEEILKYVDFDIKYSKGPSCYFHIYLSGFEFKDYASKTTVNKISILMDVTCDKPFFEVLLFGTDDSTYDPNAGSDIVPSARLGYDTNPKYFENLDLMIVEAIKLQNIVRTTKKITQACYTTLSKLNKELKAIDNIITTHWHTRKPNTLVKLNKAIERKNEIMQSKNDFMLSFHNLSENGDKILFESRFFGKKGIVFEPDLYERLLELKMNI